MTSGLSQKDPGPSSPRALTWSPTLTASPRPRPPVPCSVAWVLHAWLLHSDLSPPGSAPLQGRCCALSFGLTLNLWPHPPSSLACEEALDPRMRHGWGVPSLYCGAFSSHLHTSGEMLGWMNHKLKLRLLREISITSYTQMMPPYGQKVKRN